MNASVLPVVGRSRKGELARGDVQLLIVRVLSDTLIPHETCNSRRAPPRAPLASASLRMLPLVRCSHLPLEPLALKGRSGV